MRKRNPSENYPPCGPNYVFFGQPIISLFRNGSIFGKGFGKMQKLTDLPDFLSILMRARFSSATLKIRVKEMSAEIRSN